MEPLHPGEVLQKEFLEPLGLSQNKLAMAIRVPARRINEIVLGNVELQRIQRRDRPGISRCPLSFGRACRWTMIWTWSKINLKRKLLPKSNRW